MYIQFCNFYDILEHCVKNRSLLKKKDSAKILFDYIFASYTKDYPINPDSARKMANNERQIKQEILGFYEEAGIETLAGDILDNVFPELVSARAFAKKLNRAIQFDLDLKENLKYTGTSRVPEKDGMALALYVAEVLFAIMRRPHVPYNKDGTLDLPEWLCPKFRFRLVSRSCPKPSSRFIGRNKELKKLHDQLEKRHEVFLWGLHGIGKSELAYEYCERYRQTYDNILYIHSTGNLRADICTLQIYGGFPYTGDMFRDLLYALQCPQEKTLLIIDNLNLIPSSEEGWASIQQCGCKLLVTTRCKPQGPDVSNWMKLGAIKDMRSLIALVKAISQNKHLNTDILKKIIKTVHRHTTAVVLLAMLLEKGRYTTGEILRKLQPRNLKDFIKDKIFFRYREDSFYEHLRTLFHLFQFEGLERDALQNMVLVPETGIPLRLFEKWTELHDRNIMDGLLKHGMVYDNHSNTNKSHQHLVSLRPILRELACEEFTPSFKTCATLIRNTACAMNLLIDDDTSQYLLELSQEVIDWAKKDDIPAYIDYLKKCFEAAARQENRDAMKKIVGALDAAIEKTVDPTNIDRALLEDYRATLEGNPTTAIRHRLTAITFLDASQNDEKWLMAEILDHIAGDYSEKCDWSMAKQYSDMSSAILTELCPLTIPDVFPFACRRGVIFCKLGAVDEGMKLLHQMEEFLQMCDAAPTLNHVYMHSALADAYYAIEDHENEKKHIDLVHNMLSLVQKMMQNEQ